MALATLGLLQDNPWPLAGAVVIAVAVVRALGDDPHQTSPHP